MKKRNLKRLIAYLMAAVIIASVVFGSISVSAANTYEENKQTVYSFLTKNMGFSVAAACGTMANIEKESRFSPTALNSSSGAYGICQWLGVRKTRLQNYCSQNGYDYTSMDGQLNYLRYEVETYFPNTRKQMLSYSDTADAAYDAGFFWCKYFEIPGSDSYAITRGNLAKGTFWQQYGASASGLKQWVVDGESNMCWLENGRVDTSKHGLVLGEYGWFYVEGGVVDFAYNGVATNENGTYCIDRGRVNFNVYGLRQAGEDMYLFDHGRVRTDYSGIYYYNNVQYTITTGKVTI